MKMCKLLNSPARWTKGALARNRNGRAVMVRSARACRWCLMGAATVCYPEDRDYSLVVLRIHRYLRRHQAGPFARSKDSIILWQDHEATFAQIQEMLQELKI
jgi:hypothetical protein